MFKIMFVARLVEDGDVVGGYSHNLELPFIPSLGMRFEQGTSCTLWETSRGEEAPVVERVVYDLDEGQFICLFTVKRPLTSSFWTVLKDDPKSVCGARHYFRHDPVAHV